MPRASRNFRLLTGATGLLGRYLLRDLLLRDEPVAVVVRGTRHASAEDRVESLLAEIEDSLGRALPRPVVLSGNLTEPELGLSAADRAWAGRHAASIIHNAASLSFQTAERHEEPWLSNVTGTRMTLELARTIGVREFHHVSTAYVCGQRNGRVLESELDVGQSCGNDYERSKIEAEQLVRSAEWLDSTTFYRPSIIVGDSRTGFTSTYHGFYTPLHILYTVHNKVVFPDAESRPLLQALGLAGAECKNLVPVDWVAAALVHLATDRRHHGRTYHLANPQGTSVNLLSDVFYEALNKFVDDRPAPAVGPSSETAQAYQAFQRAFLDQMSSYQAYWRDDPQFDVTNTAEHAPHLRCPLLDHAMLLKLSRFAIQAKFWSPRGRGQRSARRVGDALAASAARSGARSDADALPLAVRLQVLGAGGGEWRLVFAGGRLAEVQADVADPCAGEVAMTAETFHAISDGALTPWDAVGAGALAASSSVASPREILETINSVFVTR